MDLNKPLNRKRPLSRVAGWVIAAALSAASLGVQAEPVPKKEHQVPGYYRMALGEFEVTALYDGYVSLDPTLLKGIDADNLQALFTRMFVSAEDGVQTAVNAYLVNTGTELVLVDVGAAQCFGPTLGNIARNLEASGYNADQVSMVLLTHLHPDHACGLRNTDGSATYPNATVHVPRAEAAYWLDEELAATMPEAVQPFFKMAQAAVEPYASQKRLKQYGRDTELMPGVRTVPTNGHTPGHNAYLFQSEGQDLMVWGDIVHSHTVQFARPDVTIEFDVDSDEALATRKEVFNDAAKNRFWVAGAHLPFPGLGHVRRDGAAFSWVPVEYAPLPAGQ